MSRASSAAYQTVGLISNPLLHGKFGFGSGFDFYDDFTIIYDMAASIPGEQTETLVSERSTGERLTQLAMQRLGRMDPERPFFLFVFYFDPHYDYRPPAPYDRQFCDADYRGAQDGGGIPALAGQPVSAADRRQVIGLYDGEVCFTDAQIGRLLAALKRRGCADNTVVVVTADHGEEFWDHGGVVHGHTLYDELVRVPMIVRFPPAVRPGTVVNRSVCHADLLPTVLELAGVPIPPQTRGRSLVPLFSGGSHGLDPPAFMGATVSHNLTGARTPRQKIVLQGDGAKRFYSLPDDPGEATNLWGTARTAEFADLERRFAEWKSRMDQCARQAAPTGTPDLDQRLLQQLRSLGYAR